jgi:protein involved in polysaccharide export with SLBB domain
MKSIRRLVGKGLVLFCGTLLCALMLSGCASTEEPQFTSTPLLDPYGNQSVSAPAPVGAGSSSNSAADASSEWYKLRVGDLITITFSDTPEPILPHEERVKEDGNITLSLIGSIKAVNKTVGELQSEIRSRYVPKYYVRLNATVKITPQDLFYYVDGQVRAPGAKPWISDTTVTKAVAAAGGLTEFARKSRIQLNRVGAKTRVTVDWNKAVRNPSADPRIFPGDSIYVEKSVW